MSTRTVVTFKDADSTFHIYQNWDGYPSGVAENLRSAIAYAWPLPRFEACEFGAAFVRGAKSEGGSIYLSKGPRYYCDLSYCYTVRCIGGQLSIDAYRVDADDKRTSIGKRLSIDQLAMVTQ